MQAERTMIAVRTTVLTDKSTVNDVVVKTPTLEIAIAHAMTAQSAQDCADKIRAAIEAC